MNECHKVNNGNSKQKESWVYVSKFGYYRDITDVMITWVTSIFRTMLLVQLSQKPEAA